MKSLPELKKPQKNSLNSTLYGSFVHKVLENWNLSFQELEEVIMQTGLRFFLAKGDLKSFMDKAYEQLQKIPKEYLFPPRSLNIFNELPLYYTVEGQIIYGIIDQLTLGQNWVRIVDYKTENQGKLKNKHIVQLELYALGIKKIRASKNIEAGILFLKSGEFKNYCN